MNHQRDHQRIGWQTPLDLDTYDRSSVLTEDEKKALCCIVSCHMRHSESRWPPETREQMQRLLRPLHDALTVGRYTDSTYYPLLRLLAREMYVRETSYWAWTLPQWVETIGLDLQAFERRHQNRRGDQLRQPLLYMAYILGGYSDFYTFPITRIYAYRTASRLFGVEGMNASFERLLAVITTWGYTGHGCSRDYLRYALARAVLANRSPHLEDLTLELLATLREQADSEDLSTAFGLLSRVLVDLTILDEHLPVRSQARPVTERLNTQGVAAPWVAWCCSWHERSTLTPRIRDFYLYRLMHVGRWLAAHRPDVVTPEQWDYDVAVDYIAALETMKIGEWWAAKRAHGHRPELVGKPFTAGTKDGYLTTLRRFFSDLQEIPHRAPGEAKARTIGRHFNPMVALQTPRSIKNLIGPDPQVIDDAWWWKLLAAAETLTEVDIPHGGNGGLLYPLEFVRAVAVTWCYSARRSDEIKRLRVGCIRWQWEDTMLSEDGGAIPADAICFLQIPVNKTNTAFTTAVSSLVGTAIEAWEKVRPPQPKTLDRKTNEMVDFLFSIRGQRMSSKYINDSIIPLLCERAGVPRMDKRGNITSHRARATIASLYYNAPEGLTFSELQQFLGHRHSRSTQAYVKPSPTKLAKSVQRANKHSRLVKVLVDPSAAMQGEPAIFYDLGDGTFCGNPAWACCPHRMACIKCPMHVGAELAQLIRARDGILNLLQEVPDLSEEEKAVAEGDRNTLNKLIEKYKDISAPPVPNERYIFNPAAQTV